MIHLTSFLHTLSVYSNRWGGPRYRTEELAKFLNKHLYNIQEEQLLARKKVNVSLSSDALLSSRHTPLYAYSIQQEEPQKTSYVITDELGFKAVFPRGTEILIFKDDEIKFEKIENIKFGDRRVINFELVEEFCNDKLHHHTAFSESFISIKCKNEFEVQMILCDSLSSMTLLKRDPGSRIVKRVSQFESGNIQEVYLVDIIEVKEIDRPITTYSIEFLEFSYSLKKNRDLSDKSKNRVYNYRKATKGKRWLAKMRSKVFAMKKNKMEFEMDLKHVDDKN